MSDLAPGESIDMGTRAQGGPVFKRDGNVTDAFDISAHGGELYPDEIKRLAEAAGFEVRE